MWIPLWLRGGLVLAATCAVTFSMAGGAAAQGAEAASPRAGLRERMAGTRERYAQRPLPAGTRVLRDVAYGAHPKQRFDVYLPPAPRDAPVLLMVHGGGWAVGDKTSEGVVANKAAHWLPRGWIVVSANHRLLPDAAPLVQAQDIAAATAKVQALAASWGGDPARVVLMGHSAGGHLVALLGADPGLLRAAGAHAVRGVVALDSGALDVPRTMREPPLRRIFDDAFGADPDIQRAASPIHRLRAGAPPMLAACSSLRLQACPQARDFARAADALGTRVEVLPVALSHKGVNHALGLPSPYTAQVDAFLARVTAK